MGQETKSSAFLEVWLYISVRSSSAPLCRFAYFPAGRLCLCLSTCRLFWTWVVCSVCRRGLLCGLTSIFEWAPLTNRSCSSACNPLSPSLASWRALGAPVKDPRPPRQVPGREDALCFLLKQYFRGGSATAAVFSVSVYWEICHDKKIQ